MSIHARKELSIGRVLAVFAFGLISGIQVALYMYDFYDDGVADIKSLLIGATMVVLSIAFVIFSFRET
jgi:hypothetical protein